MVNSDVPLLVCVSADIGVRERVVRQLADCGAVLICADLEELRAMLFPAAAAVAIPTAPLARLTGAPGATAATGTAGTMETPGEARDGLPVGEPPMDGRTDGVVRVGDLVIDPAAHLVLWRGQPLPLTRLERELLGRLATPPVAVWTYQRLFDVVWGKAYLGDTSILHSAVKRLRGKLRTAGDGLCVETVRGVGYRLAVLC